MRNISSGVYLQHLKSACKFHQNFDYEMRKTSFTPSRRILIDSTRTVFVKFDFAARADMTRFLCLSRRTQSIPVKNSDMFLMVSRCRSWRAAKKVAHAVCLRVFSRFASVCRALVVPKKSKNKKTMEHRLRRRTEKRIANSVSTDANPMIWKRKTEFEIFFVLPRSTRNVVGVGVQGGSVPDPREAFSLK